ncbi:hypothetical protein GVN21_15510 [Caulobacter sp. SLTY]|uniref:hypothetical protein n=1 Tax=Caulobacter sp. SLTY TaxID=2683262 RepID=UPI0014134EFA|nr:hypothetical protein [Caulobacter sp. SLTY]NBB16729.1 hypothetical protein [Caulobacter sp. SLTY]NBB16771.1 hypothetical protein [Caulobacter sp. SLTY]
MTEKPGEPGLLVQLGLLAPVVLVWSAVLYIGEPLFRAAGALINDFLARTVSLDLGSDFGPWVAVVAAWFLILPFWPMYVGWAEPKVAGLLARLSR